MAMATAASSCSSSPCGDARLEAALEFLGDEAGGKPALAPARVLHQRGQERDVVLDPVDDEGIERVGLQVDGRLARGRMRHQLGDHGIVVHGDLGALEHAGVVADGAAVRGALLGAAGSGSGGRWRAGSCGRGPRRRCGSRPPSR